MDREPYYFIASSRVYEAFGKLERWSIIDLYREARVFPSVAKNVLENMRPRSVAKQVGETPMNRWGVSYPIYEFLDGEKRDAAYHRRFHSHCRTSGIIEAQFTDDFCECPSGFDVPHQTSVNSSYLDREAVIRSEEEWLKRSREQFDRTVLRGMYEDTDKAEQVFRWYKTIHAALLDLWGLEIASAKGESIHSPLQSIGKVLPPAVGGLMLAGAHHVKPVTAALARWYQSPLVNDLSAVARPTLE